MGKDVGIKRGLFWILVVIYFAIKYPLGVYLASNPDAANTVLAKLDTPLVIALAFVVGARLKDAGKKRWIGVVGVLVITIILPMILMFGYLAAFPPAHHLSQQEFMDLFFELGAIPSVCLIALLIWVGTRPSKPADNALVEVF